MMAEVGMAEAMQALKCAKVARDRRLMYHGAPLTSEKLRAIMIVPSCRPADWPRTHIVAGGQTRLRSP